MQNAELEDIPNSAFFIVETHGRAFYSHNF